MGIKRNVAGVIGTVVLTASLSSTAWARTTVQPSNYTEFVYDYQNDQSQWQQDRNGWFYYNPDGFIATTDFNTPYQLTSTWAVIDGNGDGIAEFYHFNKYGYLDTDTIVHDEDGNGNLSAYFWNHYQMDAYHNQDASKTGYYEELRRRFVEETSHTVNSDGQWVVDGVVQTVNQNWKTTFELGWMPGTYSAKNKAGETIMTANIEYASDSMEQYIEISKNGNSVFGGWIKKSAISDALMVTDTTTGTELWIDYDGIETLTITSSLGGLPKEQDEENARYQIYFFKEVDGFCS